MSLQTFAQILAALTTGNRESAFGLTVTVIPGNNFESLSSYLSAGPTVSTNTCSKKLDKKNALVYCLILTPLDKMQAVKLL